MTFEASLSQMGRGLALLMMEPDPVPHADLESALAARESTLKLLDALEEGGALGRRAATVDASEMVRNPTGTLNRLRAGLPRFPVADAHGLLSAESSTATGRLWLSVHRHAVVALHEWQTAVPESRPRAERSWPVVADGAALVGAIVVLDRHMVGAMSAAGRTAEAGQLRESSWSGLRLAAVQVRDLAGSGDLTDPSPLVKPGPLNPVAVRSRAGQREGQRRLERLLNETSSIHPAQLQAVLTLHVRTVARAADLVTDQGLVAVLGEHVRDLGRAARALSRIESIGPRDSRPVMQARQLELFVTAELAGDRNQDVGMAVARTVPGTITAIAACAERQVREGRWLIGDGSDPDRPLWVRADIGDYRPDALTHLHTAARNAQGVTGLTLPDPMPGYMANARAIPARDALQGTLDTSEDHQRPTSPAHRLAPPRDRGVER